MDSIGRTALIFASQKYGDKTDPTSRDDVIRILLKNKSKTIQVIIGKQKFKMNNYTNIRFIFHVINL